MFVCLFRQLYINVDENDRRLMPKDVVVYGGNSSDDSVEISKVSINA